jgi:hypothetical protein
MARIDRTRLTWRKSTFSGDDNCVEVALADEIVVVRNSKDPNGPCLELTCPEWTDFVRDLKRGEFDRP